MKINNLHHKINRKAMVLNNLNYLVEQVCENRHNDLIVDSIQSKWNQQYELYAELVATPIGGETPERILIF